MSPGRVLLSCFVLISSSLKDFIPYTFPLLSLFVFIFPWYNLSKDLGTRSNHPTPHSNITMFSVLKNPTTTPTTAAMTYFTPPPDVLRPDAAPIPPGDRGLSLPLMNEPNTAARVPQPYDAFLVLDVEATCLPGTDFHWPNEIIVRYRVVGMFSRSSIRSRNGQFVSSSGQTKGLMEWPVPCRKLQNFAALLNQLGAPSYPLFVRPSLA
jgi:hypothetical protein